MPAAHVRCGPPLNKTPSRSLVRSSFDSDRIAACLTRETPTHRAAAKRHYYAEFVGNTASVRWVWGRVHVKLERVFESEVEHAHYRDGMLEVDLVSGAHYVLDVASGKVVSVSGLPELPKHLPTTPAARAA